MSVALICTDKLTAIGLPLSHSTLSRHGHSPQWLRTRAYEQKIKSLNIKNKNRQMDGRGSKLFIEFNTKCLGHVDT